MKRLSSKLLSPGNYNFALLILRIGAASMLLTHGLPKLLKLFSGEPIAFMSVMGMSMTLSFVLATFSEAICSIFVLLGLGTRIAAIFPLITMLTAAFYVHRNDPFSTKEMALSYALMFAVILISGGGRYSIDRLITNRKR